MLTKAAWSAYLVTGILALFACASPKAPTGGVKDVKPPGIVEEESTPNKQTNFQQKEITIVFNEWVKLNDIYTQLVVSPLMPHDPEIRQKGKGIVITLPDSLKAETTYTLNFGNAIADLNEGNILENYAFVFSTGGHLDSLKLTGSVSNALTLKAADGVWVMMYPPGQDSAVYTRKPDYLAKTNKEGKWTISNVREGQFIVVALKDDNQNFLYDQESELIGWLDTVMNVSQPMIQLPVISVFPRESKSGISDVAHIVPGWLKIVVNGPKPKAIPSFFPTIDNTISQWSADTLHVWYNPENNYSGYALIEKDSFLIRSTQSKSIINEPIMLRMKSNRLRTGSSALFTTTLPVVSVDTALISLIHDSLGVIPFSININPTDARLIEVNASWAEKTKYHLTFFPGAIHDYWGRSNDTLMQSIVVTSTDQYGDLTMTVDGLDSSKQYLLLIKEGEQINDTFVIQNQSQAKPAKQGLAPGKYTIELIEDLNHNLAWDTGDYSKKRQAEKKMIFTPENLRAGWELEVKIMWTLK